MLDAKCSAHQAPSRLLRPSPRMKRRMDALVLDLVPKCDSIIVVLSTDPLI